MNEVKINVPKKVFFGLKTVSKTYLRQVPQAWADIPMPERAAYLRLILTSTPPMGAVLALQKCLKLPPSVFLNLDQDENFAVLTELFNWLDVPQIPDPLIAQFDHDGKTYHLPKTDFTRSTAYEFAYADTVYREYKQNPEDDEPLRLLVACLCRPAKRDETDIINTGDIRQEIISESNIEHRAEQFKALPVEIAYIVLKYFEGVEQRVFDALCGAGIVSKNPKNVENTEGSDIASPFWKTYRQLAKGLNKTEEMVHQMPFWSVLALLIEEHAEQERQQSEMDKIKNSYK